MSHHIGLQVLRAKLRGFQVTGSSIASRISRSSKERKNRLWDRKRALGVHCRYHHVAYGLLRGVAYERIERCAPENRLDPKRLLDVLLAHACLPTERAKFTLESVKNMLTASPVVVAAVVVSAPSSPPTAPKLGLLDRARRLLEKRA